MAYGVAIENDVGRVVISNAQYCTAFIGNATFTGVAKPLSYSAIGVTPIPGSGAPFYIYQISSVHPPMAFIQLTTARFLLCSIQNVGGNTWEIVVGGPTWGTPPVVKCFSRLVGQGSPGIGLRVRDNAGNRTWDSTEKMLIIRRKLDFPQAANISTEDIRQEAPLTGVAAPYMMRTAGLATPLLNGRDFVAGPGDQNTISVFAAGWALVDGVLSRTSRSMTAYKYLDDTRQRDNTLGADRCYIINGNDY